MMQYKQKLKDIKHFVLDVDGVLTDGSITITTTGEMVRTMNVKDGYALKAALGCGYGVCIISGGTNEGVRERLKALGITDIYLGAHHKKEILEEYLECYNIDPKTVAYMGDDIPDIPALLQVGLPTCPNDAAPEVREVSAYISHKAGGQGCVRDLIEQVLKVHGKWQKIYDAGFH